MRRNGLTLPPLCALPLLLSPTPDAAVADVNAAGPTLTEFVKRISGVAGPTPTPAYL